MSNDFTAGFSSQMTFENVYTPKTNKTSRAQQFEISKNSQQLGVLCQTTIRLNLRNSASRNTHRAALPSLKKFFKTECTVSNDY
jgi:hypothetical protein